MLAVRRMPQSWVERGARAEPLTGKTAARVLGLSLKSSLHILVVWVKLLAPHEARDWAVPRCPFRARRSAESFSSHIDIIGETTVGCSLRCTTLMMTTRTMLTMRRTTAIAAMLM